MHRLSPLSPLVLSAALTTPAHADDLTVTSAAVAEGQHLESGQVFQGIGCEGGDTAPDLAWSGAPEGTKSFAVTVYGPDAPTGSGWWHWFAFNIPAGVTELPASGAMPEGAVELTNDYGATGFDGACPPSGEEHRYQFSVQALGGGQRQQPRLRHHHGGLQTLKRVKEPRALERMGAPRLPLRAEPERARCVSEDRSNGLH